MSTKDWLQYGSAIGVLASGVAMALLSFFFNGHEISESVRWYIAQTFLNAGSAMGISTYVQNELEKIKIRENGNNARTASRVAELQPGEHQEKQ